MASKVGSKQQGDQELDPKYEWQENAANYVLRLHLSGFRKEDFRVQVDSAGRLTVRGKRADGGKHVRFHKVFQLPPTSNLDDISGCFDAGVLSLTVPKRPPATIDDIRKPGKQVKEEPQVHAKDDGAKKTQAEKTPTKDEEEARKKKAAADEKKIKEEETAAKIKKAAEDEKKIKEEEMAAKINKAAADEKKIKEEEMAAKIKKAAADEQMKMEAKQRAEQEHKRKEEVANPKLAVDRDSILERVRRRAEEEREAAERQKQQQSSWKERVTEELQGLRTSEWAEGMVDTVKKNKEVIAAAVTAFSLGLFVSSRLFSRN